MSKISVYLLLTAMVAAAALQGPPAFAATTVVVGPVTCRPGYVHFSKIQDAVTASPYNTTILICPGVYQEQVQITEPLKLQGVTDGTGNAAVITVPTGGLVVNAPNDIWGPSTAQVLVENTVGVTISDIAVDGTGSGCVFGAGRTIGIEFYNVGTAVDGTSAGRVQNVIVRNQQDGCGYLASEGGEGIVSDNSFITIASNEIHDIDRSGVLTYQGANSITSNSLQNVQNGIVVEKATTTTVVSQNVISNLLTTAGFTVLGIWVSGGSPIISRNTVGSAASFSEGIYLNLSSYGTSVTGNNVANVTYGVLLDTTSNTVAQSNSISHTYDALYDVYSGGGNSLTKNTVNEGYYGVFQYSSGSDVLTPNNLFNVNITIDPSEPLNLGSNSVD